MPPAPRADGCHGHGRRRLTPAGKDETGCKRIQTSPASQGTLCSRLMHRWRLCDNCGSPIPQITSSTRGSSKSGKCDVYGPKARCLASFRGSYDWGIGCRAAFRSLRTSDGLVGLPQNGGTLENGWLSLLVPLAANRPNKELETTVRASKLPLDPRPNSTIPRAGAQCSHAQALRSPNTSG